MLLSGFGVLLTPSSSICADNSGHFDLADSEQIHLLVLLLLMEVPRANMIAQEVTTKRRSLY